MRILAVNAGSSSLKLTLLDSDDAVLAHDEISAPRAQLDAAELHQAIGALPRADAVVHRVVHGGERFEQAVIVTAEVRQELEELCDLAPLHQPKSLAALDAVSRLLVDLPTVACFDTSFHSTLAAAERTYALPQEWIRRWGLRRYGFHGLSHAWVARRAPQLLGAQPDALRIVSCHLGAGASLCAIANGRSVATTMGFTPLEGLVMATRSGSVDPGLLLWLLERREVSTGELSDTLEHRSGLLGLTGSADMREVVRRCGDGDAAAVLGIEVYVHRLRAGIAAMAAALGGLDALVFTGGVGERSAEIRASAATDLGFLGIRIEHRLNAAATGDGEITAEGATVRTLAITAREDLEMARQARTVLSL